MKLLFPGQRVRITCKQSDAFGRETNILRLNATGCYATNGWIGDEFSNGVEVNLRRGWQADDNPYPYYVFKPEDVEPINPIGESEEDTHERDFDRELDHVL